MTLTPVELLEMLTGISVLQLATEAVAGRADGLNVAYQKVVQNRNRPGAKPRLVVADASPGAERILVYIPPGWSPPR